MQVKGGEVDLTKSEQDAIDCYTIGRPSADMGSRRSIAYICT